MKPHSQYSSIKEHNGPLSGSTTLVGGHARMKPRQWIYLNLFDRCDQVFIF